MTLVDVAGHTHHASVSRWHGAVPLNSMSAWHGIRATPEDTGVQLLRVAIMTTQRKFSCWAGYLVRSVKRHVDNTRAPQANVFTGCGNIKETEKRVLQ